MIESDDITSVLVPVTITPETITGFTQNGAALPEDPTLAWSAADTYQLGQRRHSAVTHRVYESLKDNNTGHDPTDPTNRTTAAGVGTWWLDIAPTNRFAAFDPLISTATVADSPLVLKLRVGVFNGLALFGLDADTLSIVVRDAPGGNVVYTTGGDKPLEGSMPADWYEYFFDRFKPETQFQVTGIQPYNDAEVTLTLKKATGKVRLGMLTLGDMFPLGAPQRGASVEPKSYAYISEDAYGNTTIIRRPSATGLSIPIKLDIEDADSVIQTVQDLLDVPVAVVGSTAMFYNKLSTFGLISGRMTYDDFGMPTLNLNVRGFI